jgi:hypothetical protein
MDFATLAVDAAIGVGGFVVGALVARIRREPETKCPHIWEVTRVANASARELKMGSDTYTMADTLLFQVCSLCGESRKAWQSETLVRDEEVG